MAKIFLSVPILDKPELKCIFSIYQACHTSKNHKVRLYFNENDSLISRVRNVHLSAFLNEFKDCDYYMSIDSDLEIVNSYPNNNIFDKLVAADKDFVGGLYALKNPKAVKTSSLLLSGQDAPDFDSGIVPVKWLSSGCWCIKRSVLEKMAEAYPELEYDGDDNASGKKIFGFCIPYIHEYTSYDKEKQAIVVKKKYLSEDWAFCERWRKIGGEIFADTSIVLNHIGKAQYSLWNLEVKAVQQPQQP